MGVDVRAERYLCLYEKIGGCAADLQVGLIACAWIAQRFRSLVRWLNISFVLESFTFPQHTECELQLTWFSRWEGLGLKSENKTQCRASA